MWDRAVTGLITSVVAFSCSLGTRPNNRGTSTSRSANGGGIGGHSGIRSVHVRNLNWARIPLCMMA
jgi:hypothetical protein